jgi:Ca2+-binding RTX toxin-like protein
VFVKRLVSNGAGSKLNSPWGMVVAPASFGDFGGDLLVGNFGDGHVNAYDATTGAFAGTLKGFKNKPVTVDGLWGLAFGNGVTAGDTGTLYFAAGPHDEAHGLFGKITANPAGTSPVTAVLSGDVLTITGGPDADNIHVRLQRPTNQIIVQDEGVVVGTFDAAAVGTIEIMGLAGNDHIVVGPKIDATIIADGGADNDKIMSGKDSTSILLGGPGNDMLFAGHGRDVLIGGDGKDQAHGFQGDDILIGGSTASDTNTAALLQILDEWNSSDSFDTRVMKLSTGAGGLPTLDSTTVLDDNVVDHLVGGPGQNWFFAGVGDKRSKH